jgi:hypothetical protein
MASVSAGLSIAAPLAIGHSATSSPSVHMTKNWAAAVPLVAQSDARENAPQPVVAFQITAFDLSKLNQTDFADADTVR